METIISEIDHLIEADKVHELESSLLGIPQGLPRHELKANALVKAVVLGREHCVEVLLAAGANPLKKVDGKNAVHRAIAANNMAILTLLVCNLPTPNASDQTHPNIRRLWYDESRAIDEALFIACMMGSAPAVELLLELGASPNCRQHYDDEFMLSCSVLAAACHTPMRRSPPPDAVTSAEQIVERLINAGANVKQNSSTGETALHWATLSGMVHSIGRLVEAGADVNAVDDAHWTALCYAIDARNLVIADQLLQNGADANGATVTSSALPLTTPLYLATSIGDKDLVLLLLRWFADVNREVNTIQSHSTVFNVALGVGNFPLASLFITAGVNPVTAYQEVIKRINKIYSRVPGGFVEYLPPSEQMTLKNLKQVLDDLMRPCELKHSCRLVIRQCVGNRKSLKSLMLPKALIEYVSFDIL